MGRNRTTKNAIKPKFNAVIRNGDQVEATYEEQEVPIYQGIPTLEALGPILSKAEVISRLASSPPYSETERQLRPEVLLHVVQASLLNWFRPLALHIDLQQRLDRVIRGSLPYRNPIAPGYHRKCLDQADRLPAYLKRPASAPYQRTTALGFHFTAPSGMGKTTAVEHILMELYPQRIVHTEYKGKPFPFDQLVWLHLDCPGDGSLKQLLIQFLQAVDAIIGKTKVPSGEEIGYYELYGASRATVDSLISAVAAVAANHCLSVLIIDEIQHLLHADGDGADKVLNYLVTLVNTIGLPVILVGTPRAKHILSKHAKQIRRGTGQGELEWQRLERESRSYSLMSEGMWPYQYTAKPIPLTEGLKDVLFEETQGITDYMIKAYMMAQWRSITTGKPLTIAMLRSVAKDGFVSARPILRALRLKNFSGLKNLDDVHPPDLDPMLQAAQQALNEALAASAIKTDLARNNEDVSACASTAADTAPPQECQTPQQRTTHPASATEATTHRDLPSDPPTLRDLHQQAEASGTDFYDLLRKNNVVNRPMESGPSAM